MFGTTFVGLTVGLRDSFSSPARAVRQQMRYTYEYAREVATRVRAAFSRENLDMGRLKWSLLTAAAGFYALGKAVDVSTEAFTYQYQSLQRLEHFARRWGRDTLTLRRDMERLSKEGVFTRPDIANLQAALIRAPFAEGRGFSEAASDEIIRTIRDIASAQRPAGMSVMQTVQQAVQGVAEGNVEGLKMLGIPVSYFHEKMLSQLEGPGGWQLRQRILLQLLRTSGREFIGEYDKYQDSFIGINEDIGRASRELRQELGIALAPSLRTLSVAVRGATDALVGFVRLHPGLVQFGLIAASLAIGLPVVIVGFTALGKVLTFLGAASVLAPLGKLVLVLGGLVAAWKLNVFGIREFMTERLSLDTGFSKIAEFAKRAREQIELLFMSPENRGAHREWMRALRNELDPVGTTGGGIQGYPHERVGNFAIDIANALRGAFRGTREMNRIYLEDFPRSEMFGMLGGVFNSSAMQALHERAQTAFLEETKRGWLLRRSKERNEESDSLATAVDRLSQAVDTLATRSQHTQINVDGRELFSVMKWQESLDLLRGVGGVP